MPDYDVITIGAGNGGLTAALSLAQAGHKVLLLERHNVPGGCATSFVRGRFEFEVALHQLSGIGTETQPGPLRMLLDRLGVLSKLELVEMANLYRCTLPGQVDITLKAERTKVIEELIRRFPHERAGIEGFFKLLYEFCMQLVAAVFMRDPEACKEKYPLYFSHALRDTQSVLDEYVKDPLLQTVLTPYWSYMGLPPRQLAFMDFALVLFAYIEFKPFHLKGGSQMLSMALLDAFLQAGGHARFNCAAERIIVKDQRVRAVRTAEGEEITTRAVASNAGPITTLIDLVGPEHCPDDQLVKLRRRSVGVSAFTIYLGLDCEPAELGLDCATNFIGHTTDVDHVYQLQRTLLPPEMALLTCYDVDDPEFSPAGCSQMSLVTLMYGEPWLNVAPTNYHDTKFRFGEELLKLADPIIPGFRDHIEEMEIATPLTHMRYLGHVGGSIYGSEKFARESQLFLTPRTQIGGLYTVGAWNGSGGFQPTLESGTSVARTIIQELKG